jgi:hypothetical protein
MSRTDGSLICGLVSQRDDYISSIFSCLPYPFHSSCNYPCAQILDRKIEHGAPKYLVHYQNKNHGSKPNRAWTRASDGWVSESEILEKAQAASDNDNSAMISLSALTTLAPISTSVSSIAAASIFAPQPAKKSHKKKLATSRPRPGVSTRKPGETRGRKMATVCSPPVTSSGQPGETRGRKMAVRNHAPPSQNLDLFANIQSGSMRRFAKAQELALESLSNSADVDADANADNEEELEDAAISIDSSKVQFCMHSVFSGFKSSGNSQLACLCPYASFLHLIPQKRRLLNGKRASAGLERLLREADTFHTMADLRRGF